MVGYCRRAALVGAVLCAAAPAHGQVSRDSVPIEPGSLVRFQVGTRATLLSGFVTELTSDSLGVERCPACWGRLRYARADLTRLDVRRQQPASSRVLGGFALGGIAGFGLGFLSATTCKGGDRCDGAVVAIPFLAIFGGLFGATVGYLTSYKWQPVSLAR